ncbi:MAG: carbohydrate ABC transporter permease [Candidatus Sumerlaeaceae bacterium]
MDYFVTHLLSYAVAVWNGVVMTSGAKAGLYLLLTLLALLLFVPMLWMTLGAFAPQSELQTRVPMQGMFRAFGLKTISDSREFKSWTSTYLTTENFASSDGKNGLFDITTMRTDEFRAAPIHHWLLGDAAPAMAGKPLKAGRLILWFENTLVIALVVTFLSVLLNAMAGYAFAKLPFPGRNWIFWAILASIMIPGQVTIIPLFLLVTRGLGWHDSLWSIVLPQVAAPVGIFLMRQYMQGLPTALEEAARIDGCSEPGIFARIILPLSKPVLAVWATFTFIGAWKAFLWPLIVTNDQNRYMLEVGLKTLQFSAGPRNVGVVMSAALLASFPMIIVFFLFQKHLTKGLTMGGVKG